MVTGGVWIDIGVEGMNVPEPPPLPPLPGTVPVAPVAGGVVVFEVLPGVVTVDGGVVVVGGVGGVVDGVLPPCVVALTPAVCADTFPAASYAETVYEYAVEAVRPVFEYEFVVVVVIWVPFR